MWSHVSVNQQECALLYVRVCVQLSFKPLQAFSNRLSTSLVVLVSRIVIDSMATATWAHVDELYAKALLPDAQLVYLCDEIIKALINLNAAYSKKVPPKMVGIHSANRDGMGVVEESVHGILCDINDDGFVWSAVEAACAFEDQPDQRHARFTLDMCNSEPMLASFDLNDVKYVAVACTHTNIALASAIDGAKCEHESISQDGRISRSKLSDRNENMRMALDNGLQFTIIKAEVETKYPRLAELIQRSKNKIGQTQRRPDMWQTLMHIQRDAVRLARTNPTSTVDWNAVQRHAEKTKVDCVADIPAFIMFLKVYGGEELVGRLARFAKKRVKHNTVVPGSLFKAIAELRLQPKQMCPLFAYEIVKTCDAASTKVIKGQCVLITAGTVAQLSKPAKIASMIEAEAMLKTLQDVNSTIGTSADLACDTAASYVVRMVLGLPLGQKKFESLLDIGNWFWSQVREMGTCTVPSTWKGAIGVDGNVASSSPAATEVKNILMRDAKGDVSGVEQMLLQQHGFVKGTHVKNREGVISEIVDVDESAKVTIVDVNTAGPGTLPGTEATFNYESFIDQYKVTKFTEKWLDYPKLNFVGSADQTVLIGKCAIHLAMSTFTADPRLLCREKPKAVFASATVAKDKLMIVAHTQNIKAINSTQDAPAKVPLVKINKIVGFKFFALPFNTTDLPVPYWFVRSSSDEDEVNVVLKYKEVKVMVGDQSYVVGIPVFTNPKVVALPSTSLHTSKLLCMMIAYTHACMHACMHSCRHACMHACAHAYMLACEHASCVRACARASVRVCMHA